MSRNDISDIENGRLWRVTVWTVGRALNAMDARLDLRVLWRGAGLDRLLDDGHAQLVGEVARRLRMLGWRVEIEVTYASYGERGSIDILAWHPAARVLLVVEVKTELGSIEGLLRPLDVKARLAAGVARERFGWVPASVGRLVVLPESTQVRRAVARHGAVLDVALPERGLQVRRWLAAPAATLAGLWILSSAALVGTKPNPSAVRRVRVPNRAAKRA